VIRFAAPVTAVVLALTATGVFLGLHGREHHNSAGGHALSFAWFSATAAPASWHRDRLPDGAGVLAAPPQFRRLPADPGTLVRELQGAGSSRFVPTVYLNATPQQGSESLANWANFRLAHLLDDDASSARLDATARGLRFLGGTGSCVLDDYVTKLQAHPFREVACFVQGPHGGSVVVAATLSRNWPAYSTVVERSVEAYAAM
jgi:hypothetical protein